MHSLKSGHKMLFIYSVFFLHVTVLANLLEAAPTGYQGIILSENFDINEKIPLPNTGKLSLRSGASIVPKGRIGNALHLPDGAYAEIEPAIKLNAHEGTISFWVKPLWKKGDERSHTLLTMRWADAKKGYMAISQGWWEPDGAGRFYFILSNQEHMHCSKPYTLEPEAWSMVTVMWRAGKNGFCRLYIDAERIADFNNDFVGNYHNSGPIILGNDNGATDQRGRSGSYDIDEVQVFGRVLYENEIRELFRHQGGDSERIHQEKWQWLNDGLKVPVIQKRDNKGRLLESRVILDEDITWATSREETDKILNRIKSAGFNVYIPCVWHGQGTHYPTVLTSPDARLQKTIAEGFDPLAYLIKKAHGLGIQVFPWFTVTLRYDNRFPKFYDDGTPKDAYNIHNPEFRKFITDLMLDVVQRYDVDGINLDYIRTMGICTSSVCKDDYLAKTAVFFQKDYKLKDKLGAARSRIQKWQDDAVGDVVSSFSKRARELKPKLVISVDGHLEIDDAARQFQGRNELEWANRGWIDVIFNMDYQARVDFEKATQVMGKLPDKRMLIELFGNYEHEDDRIVPRQGEIIAKYMGLAQRAWPGNGMALYLYSMLSDEQIKALKAGPFKGNAIPDWPGSKSGK